MDLVVCSFCPATTPTTHQESETAGARDYTHLLALSIHHRSMENGTASEGRDPSGFLSEIIGAPVTVKLNSGVVYKGVFSF